MWHLKHVFVAQIESSSLAGCHEFRMIGNASGKVFQKGEFLVDAVVRNLNFSILNQLSGSVKKISV